MYVCHIGYVSFLAIDAFSRLGAERQVELQLLISYRLARRCRAVNH